MRTFATGQAGEDRCRSQAVRLGRSKCFPVLLQHRTFSSAVGTSVGLGLGTLAALPGLAMASPKLASYGAHGLGAAGRYRKRNRRPRF